MFQKQGSIIYPGIKEDAITASIRSLLESN